VAQGFPLGLMALYPQPVLNGPVYSQLKTLPPPSVLSYTFKYLKTYLTARLDFLRNLESPPMASRCHPSSLSSLGPSLSIKGTVIRGPLPGVLERVLEEGSSLGIAKHLAWFWKRTRFFSLSPAPTFISLLDQKWANCALQTQCSPPRVFIQPNSEG
jgi:hypothetical protein